MRSDMIKTGVERAPNRSLLYALGFTKEEMERPLVGIVSSYNEIVPGHMHLDKLVEAVKAGVRMAGGTPVMFPAIAVCDGIAMGHVGMKYSLVTRDLIADSTEAMVLAHQFDGLVLVPNCDKNVPGLLMAAARLNIPAIFCAGGPMEAGRLQNGKRTCLSDMFEAVGAYHAGKLDEAGVEEYEENACPTCGSCSGMYTANSMNCLTEAIGMALRGNGTIPATRSARLRLAKKTGMQVMELIRRDIRPRDIHDRGRLSNAETVDMALGCSTNTMLHLPAIAHEAGVKHRPAEGQRHQRPDAQHLPPGACRQHLYGGSGPGRRRVRRDEGAGGRRTAGYQPYDRHRRHRGGEHRLRGKPGPGDHPAPGPAVPRLRRHRGAHRQPGSQRLRRQAGGGVAGDDDAPRPRPGL
jgi:dihydroxy-acid dehydratase